MTYVQPTLGEIEQALSLVRATMPATPTICWPLLSAQAGCEVWVKHENHTATGAFKLRGGPVYMHHLAQSQPGLKGVIAATRGNHGQSIAFAAAKAGLKATIVVPHGNSAEKNAAMRGFGAELVEHGRDFNEALDFARDLAKTRGLHLVPSFHAWLVAGVATWAYEMFNAVANLDTLYVPIGLGSGICGAIAVRDGLGLPTRIVGVVAANAPTYARSFAAGRAVPTNSSDTMADGMAVRIPDEQALAVIRTGCARIVEVSEDEIEAAMRAIFSATHNVAEGAGAAAYAALLKEGAARAGKRAGVVISGGNIDRQVFARVLAGT